MTNEKKFFIMYAKDNRRMIGPFATEKEALAYIPGNVVDPRTKGTMAELGLFLVQVIDWSQE